MNRDELRKTAFPEYRSAEPILVTNFAQTRMYEKLLFLHMWSQMMN